jgi:iron-sulfur cluster assembly protein
VLATLVRNVGSQQLRAVANGTIVAKPTRRSRRSCGNHAIFREVERGMSLAQAAFSTGREQTMIELTESAVNAIRDAIAGSEGPVVGLRIMVEAGGCAGYKYMMGLVADRQADDIVVEKDGIKVFVDPSSSSLLNGVTIDFSVTLEGAGFTFTNPNAKSACSCGKSFS